MNRKDIFLTAIGLLGYAVWGVMAYHDPAQRIEFLHFTILGVTTTAAIVIRDMQPVKNDSGDATP
jgi:hypothetical protein